MTQRSPAAEAMIRAGVTDPRTVARYRSLIHNEPSTEGCLIWIGAISGAGHGRFWLGRTTTGKSVAVIAHRFAWALAHGADAILNGSVIHHRCDNPLCQLAEHLVPGTVADNTEAYWRRRGIVGNPLRDVRGSRARAEAIRQAARTGVPLSAAELAGTPEVDRCTPLF